MPKGALGQAAERRRPGGGRPGHRASSARRPRFDAEGRLSQRRRGHRGDRQPQRAGASSRATTAQPEAEAERTRDGWYWTGDLAYRDAEGYFFFAGRRGDWLRVDSENFAAGPVETVLSRHPDVSVVRRLRRARPDDRRGRPGDGRRRAAARVPPSTPTASPLARRPTRPRDQVGPALRAADRLAPPDRHRQGDQGRPAHARRGTRRRPGLVAPGRRPPATGRFTDEDRAGLADELAAVRRTTG